jgi:hypothetical protein
VKMTTLTVRTGCLFLAAMLFLVATVSGEDTIVAMSEFEAGLLEGQRLQLIVQGQVTLVPSPDNQVRISQTLHQDARIYGLGKKPEERTVPLTVSPEVSSNPDVPLVIQMGDLDGFWAIGIASIKRTLEVVIEVPRDTNLKLYSERGDVHFATTVQGIEMEIENGDVLLDVAAEELDYLELDAQGNQVNGLWFKPTDSVKPHALPTDRRMPYVTGAISSNNYFPVQSSEQFGDPFEAEDGAAELVGWGAMRGTVTCYSGDITVKLK